MAITQADILARCPELAGVTDAGQWTAAIADAALFVDPIVWGDRANLGMIFLAAHFLGVNYPALLKGQLQSVSVGPVSKTMAVPVRAPSRDDLGSTKFGQRYLELVDNLASTRAPSVV